MQRMRSSLAAIALASAIAFSPAVASAGGCRDHGPRRHHGHRHSHGGDFAWGVVTGVVGTILIDPWVDVRTRPGPYDYGYADGYRDGYYDGGRPYPRRAYRERDWYGW